MAHYSAPRVGRPSLTPVRQRQIVSAFIALVAEMGLERVTLDDVAMVAGVHRAALRHFVGNREELIAAAVDELIRRHERSADIGGESTFEDLVTEMFSGDEARGQLIEIEAWNVLLAEAVRRPAARGTIRRAYDVTFDRLTAALRREHPSASTASIRDLAYVVVCLAEQNRTFQQLGYPRARHVATRRVVLRLAGNLDLAAAAPGSNQRRVKRG